MKATLETRRRAKRLVATVNAAIGRGDAYWYIAPPDSKDAVARITRLELDYPLNSGLVLAHTRIGAVNVNWDNIAKL